MVSGEVSVEIGRHSEGVEEKADAVDRRRLLDRERNFERAITRVGEKEGDLEV